nr:ribonuclease HII [Chlamydiota bacterium]
LKHPIPSQKVIKGDRLSQSIMAAAIIAKKSRDDLMHEYHEKYPQYGFDGHKGYGTKRHYEALQTHGPSPIHRLSFRIH